MKESQKGFSTSIGLDVKGNKKGADRQRIAEYLYQNTATCTMLCKALGIEQKTACRRKRELEKDGILFELYKGLCKHTGEKAAYLTTNKALLTSKTEVSCK